MADELNDLRDRLAGLCGWVQEFGVEGDPVWCTRKAVCEWRPESEECPADSQDAHPFPVNDLTTLAAAWPEGWVWYKRPAGWYAEMASASVYAGPDTGDEYADRLRLTVAVLGKGEA